MNEKGITNILDNIDISEKEFDHIDVELNDIEKKRIRKNYKKTIIKKSSIVKKVGIACALVIAISITPIIAPPAMASNIPILSNIYETLGIYHEYKDYTTYIGQSINVSKYTYTIDNIMVTPYKSLMAVKITSTEPIPEDHEGFMITPSIGGVHCDSGSSQDYRIDDHNIVITFEHDYLNKIPKKSTIKIDIESFDYRDTDSHGTFEFKSDFDRSYTEFTSLPVINTNIDKYGVKVKEINSSIIETNIVSEGYEKDKLKFLLNIDGKLYGGLESLSSGKMTTRIEGLNVNAINNSKNISLLIYEAKYSEDECDDRNESLKKIIEQPTNIEEQNVFFLPYYNFLDGHKGEFYNLEKNENTIIIHYKGESSDIISLSDMSASYEGNINLAISKVILNPNDKNDFILEFNNLPKDKKIKLSFLNMRDINNSYTLLDTVKVK
ncbi:hypothetical protein psyc5s11_49020 [Clostridium gelidum]|uniref:DUF4179 domain-containing protein n=1 Tax=Clostridium gelidum TaxID=704125 RepID=A0ABM7TCK6_9CLOT|nr:DUF4179 domain-containing protein [Clostridium gelidum]BCZ48835.1 hypothetical protein psyc5s11_49020 [Clostridium gelidum]